MNGSLYMFFETKLKFLEKLYIKILKMTQRKLSDIEIENIIDFIKPQKGIPLDTAMSVVNMGKERLRNQLRDQMVYPEIIQELKTGIQKYYQDSLIQAGESVGVICAQSIGEKQTQTTLNTFHRAGQSEKTMTSGVPRFQELINATKKPRNVNHKIFFNKSHKTLDSIRKTVSNNIVGMTFKDISLSVSIEKDKCDETWYEPYSVLYDDEFLNFPHCISFKLNMYKIFDFKISLQEIVKVINDQYDDLYCVFSPSQDAQFDIYVDCSEIELPDERILFVDSTNAIEIYLEECVQPVLESIILCGVHGITEVFYAKDESNEWIVETNGINSRSINTSFINFKQLLSLDIIDETRTVSNNVWDIFETLGIEAARQFLIEEFMSILDGINACHPRLLVSRMTHTGTISSITRYTMKKADIGPFGKASFEETMDNFLNASSRGEIEPTKGVSASIICGKRAQIGTGMMELRIDMSKLPIGDLLGDTLLKPKEEDCKEDDKYELENEFVGFNNEDYDDILEPLTVEI